MIDDTKNETGMEMTETPLCQAVAARGIKTARNFVEFMSALMSDLVHERMDPKRGNSACNAGGKMLKAVEMQYRYGKADEHGVRDLKLIDD